MIIKIKTICWTR